MMTSTTPLVEQVLDTAEKFFKTNKRVRPQRKIRYEPYTATSAVKHALAVFATDNPDVDRREDWWVRDARDSLTLRLHEQLWPEAGRLQRLPHILNRARHDIVRELVRRLESERNTPK